jgi:hypothetical protein
MKLKIKAKSDPKHGTVYDIVSVKTLGGIETSYTFVAGSYVHKRDAEKTLKHLESNE